MLGAYFEDSDGIGTLRGEKLQAIIPLENHETVHANACPSPRTFEASDEIGTRPGKQRHTIAASQNHETVHATGAGPQISVISTERS